MVVFSRTLCSRHSTSQLAIFLIAACFGVACAQSATPASQLQYSALTGSGNTITATRVPVVNSKGDIIYQDVTVQFDVDADGNLTLTSGFPTVVPSPNLQVSSFQTGKYVGPRTVGNGKAFITVNGPGVIGGGATVWTSLSTGDADLCTYPGSATWYVGPIANSPLAARLKKAGITSTAWSYGVSGTGQSYSCFSDSAGSSWRGGSLIGVSQAGNTITIASFSNSGGNDYSSPIDQVTYVLAP